VPVSPDITAYGSERLALIGSGSAKDLCDLTPAPKHRKIIVPRSDLIHLKARFEDALARSRNWR